MSEKIYVPGYTDRKSIDEENGIVTAMVSVKELDRDNEVVDPKAFKGPGLRDFFKNPVNFLFHRSWGFPCGKALKVEILEKGIRGTSQFAIDIPGAVGDEIRAAWEMVVKGYLNACSIGFWADEWQTDPEQIATLLPDLPRGQLAAVRRVLTRGRLAEWSYVGIPSSPSSLVERMIKGEMVSDEDLDGALPEFREVMEFARKFDWKNDAALREWCGDHDLVLDEFEKGQSVTVPRGYLETNVQLAPDEIARLSKAWSDALANGQTPILTGGVKFIPLDDPEPCARIEKRDGVSHLVVPLDDEPEGEKLSVPLGGNNTSPETESFSESQRQKLQLVAAQLTQGANIVTDLLKATEPEGEMTDEEAATKCVAALEDIGVLAEAAGATPGSQSDGPDGTSR